MKKIEPLIYKSEKPMQRTIIDLFAKVNEVIDSVNAQKPTESPKPDWVKEEIKEMMRPSDDLLFKCWVDSSSQTGHLKAGTDMAESFQRWLQTIPPDTLKEDRLLIAREVLFTMEFKSNYSEDVISALERLCGMEVGG